MPGPKPVSTSDFSTAFADVALEAQPTRSGNFAVDRESDHLADSDFSGPGAPPNLCGIETNKGPAMTVTNSTAAKAPAPVSAYMLADHLDATLAAGEDLVAVSYSRASDDPIITTETILAARAGQRAVVERIRGLELSIIARVLKARERAEELARTDARFTMISKLFIGGTVMLADAVAECADATLQDFDTADALPAYLRSRGMLPLDTYALSEQASITIDEGFLIAGRIALGPLLDLVASFVDALELHFELYADEAGIADDADGDAKATTVSRVADTSVAASAAAPAAVEPTASAALAKTEQRVHGLRPS